MGAYVSVLFALGLVDNLQNLADAGLDIVGRELEENPPKRVRPPKSNKGSEPRAVEKYMFLSSSERTQFQSENCGVTNAVHAKVHLVNMIRTGSNILNALPLILHCN